MLHFGNFNFVKKINVRYIKIFLIFFFFLFFMVTPSEALALLSCLTALSALTLTYWPIHFGNLSFLFDSILLIKNYSIIFIIIFN